jgi:hypothetical protein
MAYSENSNWTGHVAYKGFISIKTAQTVAMYLYTTLHSYGQMCKTLQYMSINKKKLDSGWTHLDEVWYGRI